MTYTLTFSNSDDTIGTVEFPSMKEAADAGRRIDHLGGCPLSIKDPTGDEWFAEPRKGQIVFATNAGGMHLYV